MRGNGSLHSEFLPRSYAAHDNYCLHNYYFALDDHDYWHLYLVEVEVAGDWVSMVICQLSGGFFSLECLRIIAKKRLTDEWQCAEFCLDAEKTSKDFIELVTYQEDSL